MAAPDPGEGARVEVVYALPERQRVVELALPATGLTALEAVQRSGLLAEFPGIDASALVLGIYGQVCDAQRRLNAGDRVEIYRALRKDPRVQRREKVAAQRPARGRRR